MTILYWALGAVAAIFLLVLIRAALKPNAFTLFRRTRINASPDKVHALIEDFHEWVKWSPFDKMDPEGELARTYSGAARGVGSIYEWAGLKTGAGRMEFSKPLRRR